MTGRETMTQNVRDHGRIYDALIAGEITMKDWLHRHQLLLYFAMAFGLSSGGIKIVLASADFSLAAPTPIEIGLLFVTLLLGPSVSGVALTRFFDGRSGLHDLWARFLIWKVDAGCYASRGAVGVGGDTMQRMQHV
jgi:hypothetical protein